MLSRIREIIKKIPLSNFIVFMLCLCTVILVCFFSIFINLYTESTARNNLIYNRSTTALYAEKADTYLSSLISGAQTLCNNTELAAYVQNMKEDNTPTSSTLNKTVNHWLVNNLTVYDIILTDGEHKKAFYTDSTVLSSLSLPRLQENIIETAYINNNQMFLIPVAIKYNARHVGMCYLVTYSKAFNDILSKSMSIADTDFFVISNTLQVLASPPGTADAHGSAVSSFIFDRPQGDEFMASIQNEDYFVNRQSLVLSGISIYGITPCGSSFGNIMANDPYFLLIFGVALIVLLLIVYWFFHSFNRSIRKLRRFITDKKRDNDSGPVPDLISAELTAVAAEIDDTVNSIKALEHENLQIRIAHKDSQIKTLQSQLNPHFLYNALNCVVGMARYYKMDKIEQVCMSIAKITQYSLSANLLTTIGEEMKIINNYITVQQIRFPEKFTFDVDVDYRLLDHKILRFSLEPLIENAVKYAIEPMDDNGVLKIKGFTDDENIVFKISDNGSGFDNEVYSELQSRLENMDHSLQSGKGCGIGILNIHNRMRLYYGSEYGLKIDTGKNGSTITVTMPLILPEGKQ